MLKKIALFIDADNASPHKIEKVITTLSLLGSISSKKAFGNWKKPELSSWSKQLDKYDIQPIHQLYTIKRKNSTDIALTIDVIDMLYTDDIDIYAIMSSDGDFTPVADKLLSVGKVVIGFGGSDASQAFKSACSDFIVIDNKHKRRREFLLNEFPKNLLKTVSLSIKVCSERSTDVTLPMIEKLLKRMPTFSSSQCNQIELISIISLIDKKLGNKIKADYGDV